MFIIREIIKAIRLTLILWLLTAIIYPLIILAVGQFVFPYEANGSIKLNIQGEQFGSDLIGQQFTSERYFRSRPSAVEYSQGKEAQPTGISGASNLAPGNSALIKRISEEITQLKDEGIQPSADLVYASGSGLDPHISVKAAREQLERVARARDLRPDEVLPFINRYTEGKFLGIFGEPVVNVLKLNYALDVDEFDRQKQNR
ncbi:K(+)-transporting ATPase subunit C [Scytonema sp. UIC 10036]|uniref:K(+)-transporting ATPase subunit C n=1 Tax=Scytonema sp. UIC 10036 TaxID=2304196 RepID=UPI0012DAE192|nr:K(+)-transporting ATPase subunit C [Scytonema sp. UIC 10036]MUH01302.1 K(+)-transporting ATPase subunit C [Scytonema sp. UIC 10036]